MQLRKMLGREVSVLQKLASETGLQIVACTGIYTYDHLPMFLTTRDADFIAGLYVHDVEQGMQGTDAKAAFIKCAADEPGITPNVEKVHRAAARASNRTGRPIMAHSRPASGNSSSSSRSWSRSSRTTGSGRRPSAWSSFRRRRRCASAARPSA